MSKYSSFESPLPDMRQRAALEYILKAHVRHEEMWQSPRYANCVKLRQLSIPRDEQDAAYALLEMPEVFEALDDLFESWSEAHDGIAVGFAGRSGGWIVMAAHDTREEIEAMSMSELRDAVRLLSAFDRLCDEAVALFMEYATEYAVETEVVTVRRTVKRLVSVHEAELNGLFDEFAKAFHVESVRAGSDSSIAFNWDRVNDLHSKFLERAKECYPHDKQSHDANFDGWEASGAALVWMDGYTDGWQGKPVALYADEADQRQYSAGHAEALKDRA